ncbi:hypothetical protein B0T10DRAFT_591242 [Thelonectria olida]|uniref:Uncharacterized protein n=1 Tax=Thelonectria olida TaxID=1576542 RepID=A0A9P9AIC4_9HYPO|nr:hypothetical protein B0T10DRAFT_591242 [Thelonectria olida]
MEKLRFQHLPSTIFYQIVEYLEPLQRIKIPQAVELVGLKVSLLPEHITWKGWDLIFKNTKWLDEISRLQRTDSRLLPTLLGSKLKQVVSGKRTRSACLVLLLHDKRGIAEGLEDQLVDSLRKTEYDPKRKIAKLESGIKLYVRYAVGYDDLVMDDPGSLFQQKRKRLYTYVLYYGDCRLQKIGLNDIGGIEGRPIKRKQFVRDMCSVKLRCGDGTVSFVHFQRRGMNLELSPGREAEEGGQKVIVSWRELLAPDIEISNSDSSDSE